MLLKEVSLVVTIILLLSTVQSEFLIKCSPENIPIHMDPDDCCNLDSIINLDVSAKCKLQHGDNIRRLPGEYSLPTGCCFSECVLNSTGILKRGAVDAAFATAYWLKNIPDPTMAQVITKGVATCLEELSMKKEDFEMVAHLPPLPNGQRICSPLSGHFLGCFHSYAFRNCPDTRWVGIDQCQILRDYFNQCPLPFPIATER